MNDTSTLFDASGSSLSRRRFFGYAGALAGAGMLAGMSSCRKEEDIDPNEVGINLGSGDIGVLNYAYALEQLEAAFYTQVAASPYGGITAKEQAYLNDVRDHEIAHREFFKAALGSSAIPMLTPNFASINFGSRESVLTTARTFEDLGVSAYNGAGKLLTNPTYLTLAGKIVSVEARHAAIIRELLAQNSFADTSILDVEKRIDKARTPAEVLSMAGMYIKDTLNARHLPQYQVL